MEWLNKIDPNLIVGIVSLLGGWLFAKMRGEKTQSLRDRLDAIVTSVVHELVDDPAAMEKIRGRLRDACYEALGRFGIKRSKVVDAVVEVAVEEGVAELAELLTRRREAQEAARRAIEALATGAQGVKDEFAAAEARGRARMDFPAERVQLTELPPKDKP